MQTPEPVSTTRSPYTARGASSAGHQVDNAPSARPSAARPGRPTRRTTELEDSLIEAILDGQTIAKWCSRPGNPCRRTVQYWAATDPDFCTLLARAREERFYVMLEEILEIADNVPAERTALKRARLQIRARFRCINLFDPRRPRGAARSAFAAP